MIKTWIKTVIYAVTVAAIGVLTTLSTIQRRHLRDVRRTVNEQSRVIDSLLTMRRTFIEVDLNVTDKSTNKIYGSHNKGSITMPQVRTYRLVIDSTNVKVR